MRILNVLIIILILSGCATPGLIYTHDKVKIGMTKEQVMYICGSPGLWSKQNINNKIYETWSYDNFAETYNFVDNILIGFSRNGAYHSENRIEDVRNYKNPFFNDSH
jgi:hypothetical protein